MGYVIVRDSDGKYVAVGGAEHSYTDKLEEARIFKSLQTAQWECCVENETIHDIRGILKI